MTNQPSQKKILLVDDDTFLLDMYSMKFTKSGYDVKVANSTDVGLKMLHEGYIPDIMLVDIVMPGMDGLEMVMNIRKDKLVPLSTVVIMLTNQGSSDDVARAQKMTVDGYIVKATTIPSEVLKEVEKICASKKS
ncbi:MAG: response regulator [Candidatus Paceibacterota bacterium]|jgi:DNA-binding response OmpR family regulator